MQTLLTYSAELLILSFLSITFAMSFYDKLSDWNGQVLFLTQYFSKTFLSKCIPPVLTFVVLMEALITVFSVFGIYQLIVFQVTLYALITCILSCILLLIFLLGQRIAKDFDGARNISIYFIVAVFGVYLLK